MSSLLFNGLRFCHPCFQNRRTRIPLPEIKTSDHNIHTLDLGLYAEVAILPTDENGLPTEGERQMQLTKVQGDFTAWIHVESGMTLDIDFKETAILSFSIAVYEVWMFVCFEVLRPSQHCYGHVKQVC